MVHAEKRAWHRNVALRAAGRVFDIRCAHSQLTIDMARLAAIDPRSEGVHRRRSANREQIGGNVSTPDVAPGAGRRANRRRRRRASTRKRSNSAAPRWPPPVAGGRPARPARPACRKPHRARRRRIRRRGCRGDAPIARRARKPAMLAQALNRRALVEIRTRANSREAVAPRQRRQRRRAAAGRRLRKRWACCAWPKRSSGMRDNGRAARTATQSARLFKALGGTGGRGTRAVGIGGRTRWAGPGGRSGPRGAEGADAGAAQRRPVRCRQRVNMLTFHETDIAERMRKLAQARVAFESAGYTERQAVVTHNLGLAYSELGLYRRARRLLLQARATYLRAGAAAGAGKLGVGCWRFPRPRWGTFRRRVPTWRKPSSRWERLRDVRAAAYRPLGFGRIALWEGDPAKAALPVRGRRAPRPRRRPGRDRGHGAGRPCRGPSGDRRRSLRALTAAERAIAIHRKHDLVEMEGMSASQLWWQYREALQANGNLAAARRALGPRTASW